MSDTMGTVAIMHEDARARAEAENHYRSAVMAGTWVDPEDERPSLRMRMVAVPTNTSGEPGMPVEKITISSHTWDAREGLTEDGKVNSDNPDVVEMLKELTAVATSGGTAITLPGREPHQAVVITIPGLFRDGELVRMDLTGPEDGA